MATGSITATIFINEEEEYAISDDREIALEQYNENFSGPYLEYTINIEGIPLPTVKELNIDLSKAVTSTDGSMTIVVKPAGDH